jgi:hypothetical protein
MAAWTETGTRISPIFSLNAAKPPTFNDEEPLWLWFCGPVHPANLSTIVGIECFISLGLYNVIAVARDDSQRGALREFVNAHQIAWEEWEIVGTNLAAVDYSSLTAKTSLLTPNKLVPLFPKNNPICAAGREYVALLAASLSRGARYTPVAARELSEFDDVFRPYVQADQKAGPVRQGLLVTANAALSRYTSQTYAGTSPILESESHYYTHSLLGIGTASLALTCVRRFIEQIVERTRLTDRVRRLKTRTSARVMLHSLPPNDSFWDTDFLAGEFSIDDPEQQRFTGINDPRLHLLTYFSGRDGFRASLISLSAPLELLESCNCVTWTLLTITHEISHILVDGVLAFLLPNPNVLHQLEQFVSLLDRGTNVPNVFEQLQQMLCYCAWQMHSPNSSEFVDGPELGRIIQSQAQNLYEIVTHCFDFLYFYRGDADVYITAVWASWSVIPNIENRISEYLIRSLCALLTKHVRREGGISITIDQLSHLLEKIKRDFPDALYVSQAIYELTVNRSEYEEALSCRRPLALFVRHFLYSTDVEKSLMSSSRRDEFKVLEFDHGRVENPLRFIHEFSRDPAPNHLRAAWLLQQLAFGGEL